MPRTFQRPLLSTVLASLMAAAIVVPVSTQPVQARDGQTFVDLVNEYRAGAQVPPVALHDVVNRIAVNRADQLATDKRLSHDLDYVANRLAAAGVCWKQLGEIIAYNGRPESERVSRFVYQWYTSDPHRAIMLGEGYTHAGGSWTTASNGYHYAVMIFVRLCNTASARSATPFTDISGRTLEADITWVYEAGIMDGCSATRFCPADTLTRGQLAGALAAGLNLPASSRDYFDDDEGHRYEDAINRLRAAGLTSGCGDGNYCPAQSVRRGALASALARALSLPATARDYFDDDDGHRHEDAINRIAAAGIATRCGDGNYCPDSRVSRERAAQFLKRAFD